MESYHYDLTSTSSAGFPGDFAGNIAIIVIDVQYVSDQVSMFPAPPGNTRLAHFGWVSLGNDLALTLMEPGTYMYAPIWVESMLQQIYYPSPGPYASKLLWSFAPGCQANVYVLSV